MFEWISGLYAQFLHRKSACKTAFPQLKASELQKKAQEIEENAFENAASIVCTMPYNPE